MRALVIIALLAGTAIAEPRDPLAALPARYPGVGWFGGSDAPMFAYIRQLSERPKCVDEQLALVDGYFQALQPQGGSLMAFRGKLERPKIEPCIQALVGQFPKDMGITVKADGAFTIIAGKQKATYLGWAKDGTVYSGDKDQVAEALKGATSLANNGEVMALVSHIDRKKGVWVVAALDYTSKLLGVPSSGFYLQADSLTPKSRPLVPIVFRFASAGDARRAAAAIVRAAKDPRFSQALREQLAKMKPAVNGVEVAVDIVPIFEKPALYAEITALLTAIK